MTGFTLMGAITIAMTLLSSGLSAQTWTETGDAGDLIPTSQSTVGNGALTTISGSLSQFDLVDLYCITITDPLTFSATSSSPNTPLWLFRSNAKGVTSQEGIYLNTPSKITGAFVAPAGTYHLGISDHDLIPYTAAVLDIWNTSPRSLETPPNGAGAGGALASWSPFGASLGLGNYTITLTGAEYGNCSVPEPGNLALLFGSGVVCAMRFRRYFLAGKRKMPESCRLP